MDLIEESYKRLFPDKEFPYNTNIEYNRRLGNFNANIRLYQDIIRDQCARILVPIYAPLTQAP